MFAAFVDIFTMKLSVASGKTYLPIGSVLSVKQAKLFCIRIIFFECPLPCSYYVYPSK